MKIKSAKRKPNTKKTLAKNIFKASKKDRKDQADVDLIDIEVISSPATDNSSGRLQLSVASLPEKLVSQGFEKIEVVAEEELQPKLKKKASAEDIENLLKKEQSSQKPFKEKTFNVDLTRSISKKKLPLLEKSAINEKEDDEQEIELKFVKSVKSKIQKPTISSEVEFSKSAQTDRQNVLELRLGKQNKAVQDQATEDLQDKEISTEGDIDQPISRIKNDFNVSRAVSNEERETPKEEPLIKILKSKVTNSGNKRKPSISTRKEIKTGVINPRKKIQRPLIKTLRRIPAPKIVSDRINLDLPGPKSRLFVRLVNRKTGRVFRKPLRPRRLQLVPFRETYPYKSDLNLPKINVSYLNDSQALVSLTKINPRIETLSVYRREISRRPFEDEYELVNSIDDPPGSFSFIDDIENARAFKYVCVADNLPLYSFQIYKNKGFVYENMQEPFIFAYQQSSNVIIEVKKFPSFYRKLLVYRKSSAEDEEILVDAIMLTGRGRRRFRLIDDPPPIEQVIRYKFCAIDEYGIETVLEEKPEVVYTARLGRERASILKFSAGYNKNTNEVDIKGTARVENLFIATSDAELKNPSDQTLKAAARGQNIVKIQIRRINLKTREDEIILKQIINPGLSKFNTELLSLNRLQFSFSDSGENALTFGYTPLFDMTRYTYIARVIVYPLGIELRKVSDFEKIEGVVAPGRLKYDFDPVIFDHPSNLELGIMPASANSRAFENAEIVGATSRSKLRRVTVLQSDIEDAIDLEVNILPDSVFDPVVRLRGKVPQGLLDDLDHVAIQLEYDSVNRSDIIDRVFLLNGEFEYYDYSFDDLACDEIKYSLVGIGKDFKKIFTSEPVSLSLSDPKLKLIQARKKSYGKQLQFLKQKAEKRAKLRLRRPGFKRGLRNDGE